MGSLYSDSLHSSDSVSIIKFCWCSCSKHKRWFWLGSYFWSWSWDCSWTLETPSENVPHGCCITGGLKTFNWGLQSFRTNFAALKPISNSSSVSLSSQNGYGWFRSTNLLLSKKCWFSSASWYCIGERSIDSSPHSSTSTYCGVFKGKFIGLISFVSSRKMDWTFSSRDLPLSALVLL